MGSPRKSLSARQGLPKDPVVEVGAGWQKMADVRCQSPWGVCVPRVSVLKIVLAFYP